MITEVSEEQIASYRENGFLIFEEFYSPEETEALRDAVEDAIDRRKGAALPGDDPETTGGDTNPAIFQRINLCVDNPRVREILHDSRLGKLVADLEGIDRVRVFVDRAIYKVPWANPTAWHQDGRKWPFDSSHAVNVWIALEDVDTQNGCLFYLPGSHSRELEQDFGSGGKVGAMFEVYPEWGKLEAVPVALKAGGLAFHNGLMLHAATANMTPYGRRGMTIVFMQDGSTIKRDPQGVYPKNHERYEGREAKVGDLMDDEEFHPLVYPA